VQIAVFTNTYRPTINGVANVVEAYRQSLTNRGHEVYIFTPSPPGFDDIHDDDYVFRFPSIEAPIGFDYSLAIPFSLPVMRTLHGIDFDIVHTHHPLWVGVWGQWYAQWASLPLVTTIHTEYQIYSELVRLPPMWVESYLNRKVVKYCNKCHMVTTPVESMREQLQSAGVATPIELIPNPIDLSTFVGADRAEIRNKIGAGKDDIVLGYVGRLSAEKNLPVVVHAVKLLIAFHPSAQLLVVGDGSQLTELKNLAIELGMENRAHFVGEIPHKQIPHYQAAIDIFLTASLSETQPLAYTEAMAVGTPVVAVNAPGAHDMIQNRHNGMLVNPADGPVGLANAVMELIEDKELYHKISNEAKQCVKRYDVNAATDSLLAVYDRTIEQDANTNGGGQA